VDHRHGVALERLGGEDVDLGEGAHVATLEGEPQPVPKEADGRDEEEIG
jgi:hypothetical protein